MAEEFRSNIENARRKPPAEGEGNFVMPFQPLTVLLDIPYCTTIVSYCTVTARKVFYAPHLLFMDKTKGGKKDQQLLHKGDSSAILFPAEIPLFATFTSL